MDHHDPVVLTLANSIHEKQVQIQQLKAEVEQLSAKVEQLSKDNQKISQELKRSKNSVWQYKRMWKSLRRKLALHEEPKYFQKIHDWVLKNGEKCPVDNRSVFCRMWSIQELIEIKGSRGMEYDGYTDAEDNSPFEEDPIIDYS